MSQAPTIQLVCQPTWMHDEFASANVAVQHSFGIEIPRFSSDDAWWMPQEFAVRLNQSLKAARKAQVTLASPGPYLLSDTPQKFTQRFIETITVGEAKQAPANGWWKLAEGKSDLFVASYRGRKELLRDIEKSGLTNSTLLQFSPTTLTIREEYRVFVIDNKAATSSVYLVNQEDGSTTTVYDGARGTLTDQESLTSFVEEALSTVAHPGNIVVDVAVLKDGSLALLEYNPIWCSAWYNCDIDKVMQAIINSRNDNEEWAYKPDDSLVNRLARKQPLSLAPVIKPVNKLSKPPVLLGNK